MIISFLSGLATSTPELNRTQFSVNTDRYDVDFFTLSRCCASSSWMVPSILKTKIRNITSHREPAGRERESGREGEEGWGGGGGGIQGSR